MVDNSITKLNISIKRLTQLPDDIGKYTNLQILDCRDNKLTSLDNLPPSLQELNCDCNYISNLDNLPNNLQELDCGNNPLKYDFEPTLKNIRNYNAARKLSS